MVISLAKAPGDLKPSSWQVPAAHIRNLRSEHKTEIVTRSFRDRVLAVTALLRKKARSAAAIAWMNLDLSGLEDAGYGPK